MQRIMLMIILLVLVVHTSEKELAVSNTNELFEQAANQPFKLWPSYWDRLGSSMVLAKPGFSLLDHGAKLLAHKARLPDLSRFSPQSSSSSVAPRFLSLADHSRLRNPCSIAQSQAATRNAASVTLSDETLQVVSFYKFYEQPITIERVNELVEAIETRFDALGVLGRVWVASEGVNGQFAVSMPHLDIICERLRELNELKTLSFNCGERVPQSMYPFKKLVVKAKKQVLTDKLERPLDWQRAGTDVPPEEWDAALEEDGAILLDCRNTYESDVGYFVKRNPSTVENTQPKKSAVEKLDLEASPVSASEEESAEPLGTDKFSDTWDVLRTRLVDVPRETPIMTYCTGGIRCVKVNAFLEQELGFTNTKKLKDGIVGYLRHKREHLPANLSDNPKCDTIGTWRGNVFLFDRRDLSTMATSLADTAANASARVDAESILSGPVPRIIYGTAYHKTETRQRVVNALLRGFRALDTSLQPNLYDEPGVGEGLAQAYRKEGLKRKDLWLQTKFAPVHDQAPGKIPYDENAVLEEQVRQSFATSLRNLQTDYLDLFILSSPMQSFEDTLRIWRVFEDLHDKGIARFIGISNFYNLLDLQRLYENARVKPTVLLNKLRVRGYFDVDLRQFCVDHGVVYEGYNAVSNLKHFLENSFMVQLAAKYHRTPAQILFAFIRALGITPLCGTKKLSHQSENTASVDGSFSLGGEEIASIQHHLFNVPNIDLTQSKLSAWETRTNHLGNLILALFGAPTFVLAFIGIRKFWSFLRPARGAHEPLL